MHAAVAALAALAIGSAHARCPATDPNSVLAGRTRTFVELDGASDRLSLKHDPTTSGLDLPMTTGVTFELIFRVQNHENWDTLLEIRDGTQCGSYGSWNGTECTGIRLMVDHADTGHGLFVRANNCPSTATPQAACLASTPQTPRSGRLIAIPNEWNWAVVTVDSDGIDFWLNGIKSSTPIPLPNFALPDQVYDGVWLGSRATGSSATHGEIAHFRVYNTTGRMTDTQVMQVFTDTLLLGLGDSTECITIDSTMEYAGVGPGQVCQFPFTWHNVTYTGCTAADVATERHPGATWCGTSNYQGCVAGACSWGYCNQTKCTSAESVRSNLDQHIKYNFPMDHRDIHSDDQTWNSWRFFSHCADIRSISRGQHATGSAYSSSAECPAIFTAVGEMTPQDDSGPTWGFGNDTAAGETADERLEFDDGDLVQLEPLEIPYGTPINPAVSTDQWQGITIEAVFRMDTAKDWSRVFDFRIIADTTGNRTDHFWDYPGFTLARNGSDARNQMYFGMNSNFGTFPDASASGAVFHKLEASFDVLSNLNQDHHIVITGKLAADASVAGEGNELWEMWLNGDRLGFFTPPIGAFPHGVFNHNGIGGTVNSAGSGVGTHDGSISLLQIYRGSLSDRDIYKLYANPKHRSWVDRKCTTISAVGNAGGIANEQPPGSKCAFPFEWRNVTYSTCTTRNSAHPWCATNRWTESWGWGFCDPTSCSAEMTQIDEVMFGERLIYSWDFKTPGRSPALGGHGQVQPRCDPCTGTTTPNVKPVYGVFHGQPTWVVSPPKLAPKSYIELNKNRSSDQETARVEIDHTAAPLFVPQNVTFEAVFRHAKFESWSRVFDIRRTPAAGADTTPKWQWDGFTLLRYNESRNNELGFEMKSGDQWGGYQPVLGTFPTKLGQWHHAVITGQVDDISGRSTWCMWVDGVQLGCSVGIPAPAQTGYDHVAIGGLYNTRGGAQSGDIDFVRVYDKALSDAEVSSLFMNCQASMWAGQCPPVSDRVLHWWDFTNPAATGAEVINFGCSCTSARVEQFRRNQEVICSTTIEPRTDCPAGALLGTAVWTVEQSADKLDNVTQHHLTLEGDRNSVALRSLTVGTVGGDGTNALAIELVFRHFTGAYLAAEAPLFMASTAPESAVGDVMISLKITRNGGLALVFTAGTQSTATMVPTDFTTVAGQWHHVIVNGRANGQWEFWVDGSLRSTSDRAVARGAPVVGHTLVSNLTIPAGTVFSDVILGGGPVTSNRGFEGDLGLVALYGGNAVGLDHWSILSRFQHIDVSVPTTGVTDRSATQVLHYWSFDGTAYPFVDQVNPTASTQDISNASTISAIGTVMTDISELTKTHLTFDGASSRAQFTMSDGTPGSNTDNCIALGPTTGFTVEAIFRHRDRRSWARIFDFRDQTASGGQCDSAENWQKPGFALMRGNVSRGNKLTLTVKGADCQSQTGTWNHDFDTKLDVWHRAIVTGGPSGWSLWIDGDLLANGPPQQGDSGDLFPNDTHFCTGAAGAMYDGGSAHRGEISVLRIWPQQFTESQILRQYGFEGAAAIAEPSHNWEFADAFGQNVRDFGTTPTNGTLAGNPIWFDAESVLRESEGCSLCVHSTPPASGKQTAYYAQNYGAVVGSCYDCNGTAQGPAQWLVCGCERDLGICGCDDDDACTDCDGVPYGANCDCAKQNQCRVDVFICADDLNSYSAMQNQYDFDQFANIVDFDAIQDRMLGGSVAFDAGMLSSSLSFLPASQYNPDGTRFNQSSAQQAAMDLVAEYMNTVPGRYAFQKTGPCPSTRNNRNNGGKSTGGGDSDQGGGALGAILGIIIAIAVVVTGGYIYMKYIRGGGSASSASKYGQLSVNADNDAIDDGEFDATTASDDDEQLIDDEIMA